MTIHRNTPLISALISVLGWGMVGIFIRLSSLQSPLLIISIRFFITFIVLFLVLLFQGKTKQVFVEFFTSRVTIILSLVLFLTYFLGTMAFMLASIGEVTLLISISPFFVILFKRLKGEGTSRNELWGTIIAILGVIIIMLPKITMQIDISSRSLLGDILALTAALLFAVFVVISNTQDRRKKQVNSLSVTLGTCFFGILVFLYLMLFDRSSFPSKDLTTLNILSIFALGFFSTAVPTFGFAYASKKTPPVLLSNILLLEPVFAISFAYLFLAEIPHTYIYPGIFLIFIGLLKVSRK